jgi:predicted RNA-binding Zn-ribbon protein involved in translation (DUF1610 family)
VSDIIEKILSMVSLSGQEEQTQTEDDSDDEPTTLLHKCPKCNEVYIRDSPHDCSNCGEETIPVE